MLFRSGLQTALPAWLGTSGSYEVIVFGIILVLVLKYMPNGLWSLVVRPKVSRSQLTISSDAKRLPPRGKPATEQAVLEVLNIRKQFGGLTAVNDISFEIAKGEIVGLIGPNGAGKSTTFNLISGVLSKTSGSVHFLGQEVTHLPSRDISRLGMARTFQHVKMIADMTVLENVALGAHARGHLGIVSAMLRTNQAEEQSLMKEAQIQLERVGLGDQLHELARSEEHTSELQSH